MLTSAEAKKRVKTGALYLDRVRPGWFNRIDVGTLTLHDPCGCVVGQLVATDDDRRLIAEDPEDNDVWISVSDRFGLDEDSEVVFGFNLSDREHDEAMADLEDIEDDDEAYRLAYLPLQDAWVAAIADRQLAVVRAETVRA